MLFIVELALDLELLGDRSRALSNLEFIDTRWPVTKVSHRDGQISSGDDQPIETLPHTFERFRRLR